MGMTIKKQTSLLGWMGRLNGEAFVEEHREAILEMFHCSWDEGFREGLIEGFREGYEECMCDSSWPDDLNERIIS